jgi:DNA excision repair protein ERCC-6-like 2
MSRPVEVIHILDDEDTASEDEPSASPTRGFEPATRKRKVGADVEAKVEWTDDSEDDAVFATSKKRRKSEGSTPNKKGKQIAKASAAAKGKNVASRRGKKGTGDDDLPEDLLPDYLKTRHRKFNERRTKLKQAGLVLPPTYEDVEFSDDERLEQLGEKPKFDERSGVKPSREYRDIFLEQSAGIIPASIAQYLRDYQVEGVRFLHRLFVYQEGGILGDDMGLGKTVQVAAFLTAMFGKTGDKRDARRMRKFRNSTDRWYPRVLIVCPGSLTQNWKQELDRWGWWVSDLYHGANKDDVLGTARAGRLEVMITTYTTYKNNHAAVNRVTWDAVVADECHCLKDPSAEVTKAMNEVNALCRIGLTGTAIQNKYEELWTLLNWTNPGLFGTLAEWTNTISKPLTIGQSHDATYQQLSTARKTAKKLVDNLLPRFFLRRLKSLIAHQLPKKSDRVVFCPLSELQRQAYETFLTDPMVGLVKYAFEECDCESGKKRGWCCYTTTEDGDSWRSLVFPLVMSLQKLSSHLTLLIPSHSETIDKHERDIRYLRAAMPSKWKELYNQRDSLLNLANPEFCGKWGVMRKLLKFWHTHGDKVLVFSHSVRLLRILQYLFSNTSYNVSYLDGSLSYEDRQNTVDDFNSDPNQFVFLISTKAGGVGLNITSANKVVIMDPHWNPAYDLQAQDRAYRIGQVRDVEVYRLVSAGTIEEITYARQIYKQQQANIGYTASNERRYFKGVQNQADRKGEIFGLDNLLSYHPDQVVLRDIVNKTNIAEARAGVSLMDVDMKKAAEDASQNGLVKNEEDPDNGDGGLGQLAAIFTKEDKALSSAKKPSKKRKSDVVQAILVSAGVEYTHENSEVVGSSKVEDKISRQAQLEGSQDANPVGRAIFLDDEDSDGGAYPGGSVAGSFLYNPPEDVMQRQFCTMAKTFGFPGAVEFALAVEGMSQEQRRNTLDLFYKKRLEHLKQQRLIKSEDEKKPPKEEAKEDAKQKAEYEEKYEVKDEKATIGLKREVDVALEHKVKSEPGVYETPTKVKDKKPPVMPKCEASAVTTVASVPGSAQVKVERPASIIKDNKLGSIWILNDDETDEL